MWNGSDYHVSSMPSQKVLLNSIPDITLSPQWEGKMRRRGGGFSLPLLADQAAFCLKQSKVKIEKATTWYILVFFQNLWEFAPKSKKQYLKCLKGKGPCQPSSTRLLEMGMRSSWMIGMTCCHYQLRVRKFTWCASPFYPVPGRQHFSMVESVQGLL